jgi:hypothetical protein
MNNENLLHEYEVVYGTSIPLPLEKFILKGELIGFPKADFINPETKEIYEIDFLTDIGSRGGGVLDQSIRIAIAEKYKNQEPIGFADLKPLNEDEQFIYNLVIFPKYDINCLDESDTYPVYILKHKGYPIEDEMDEEEMEDDFECELQKIGDSFDKFISTLRKQ